jgi:hypothetical protein
MMGSSLVLVSLFTDLDAARLGITTRSAAFHEHRRSHLDARRWHAGRLEYIAHGRRTALGEFLILHHITGLVGVAAMLLASGPVPVNSANERRASDIRVASSACSLKLL